MKDGEQKNFTLMEVLIVTLLLSITSTSLLAGLRFSIRQGSQSNKYLIACSILQRGMDDLERDIVGRMNFYQLARRLRSGNNTKVTATYYFDRDGLNRVTPGNGIFKASVELFRVKNTFTDLVTGTSPNLNSGKGGCTPFQWKYTNRSGLIKAVYKVEEVGHKDEAARLIHVEGSRLFCRRNFD
ncbi:type II secretion system protein J [Candidatus Riflebacteria bacterium]